MLGTLMSLCDDPEEKGLRPRTGGGLDQTRPGGRRAVSSRDPSAPRRILRVPIIVTANDLSTLYAPLLRDGRMDKFFWKPTDEEKLGIIAAIVPEPAGAAAELLAIFPNQPVDFFAAIRARLVSGGSRLHVGV